MFDNVPLELWIVRVTQRSAEWKTDPEGPWRSDGLGLFFYQADLGCGDSFRFKKMSKPADGARAVRSDGNQQDAVDLLLFQDGGQRPGFLLHPQRVRGSHKGIVVIGN